LRSTTFNPPSASIEAYLSNSSYLERENAIERLSLREGERKGEEGREDGSKCERGRDRVREGGREEDR